MPNPAWTQAADTQTIEGAIWFWAVIVIMAVMGWVIWPRKEDRWYR